MLFPPGNRLLPHLLQTILVLTLFSIFIPLISCRPSVHRLEYIKAVNYFGKSWPVTFWNSDLSGVSADFQELQKDGFNSIVLMVPWGEFQPGIDPIRFNDEAYNRLTSVCSKAHSAGLKVFMRPSYTWDFYPGVQQPNTDRNDSLIGGTSLIPAWDRYLTKVSEATRGCGDGAFISWEDYWETIAGAEHLQTPEERAAYSKRVGYATWIEEHSDASYKAHFAADRKRLGVYPIPNRDNPDFEMVFRYFDDQFMNKLLPVLAKDFRQASVEARTDSDPIYNGKALVKWYEHRNHYTVQSSNYLMTFWAPATGAVNTGAKESSPAVVNRFNYTQRILSAQTANEIFIEQWLFTDNNPRLPKNNRIDPAEIHQFIRDSARPLAQFSAGYALWSWRDYRASILFNGFFALGKLGWLFSPGASVQQMSDGVYARLPESQFIRQNIPRVQDFYRGYLPTANLRFMARGKGRLRVNIGSASQDIDIQAITAPQAVTLQFADSGAADLDLVMTALSGTIDAKDIDFWRFEQISGVRGSDNSPGAYYRDIVELNRKLDDPKTVVSSISASNDSINYLVGAYSPDRGGPSTFAWVGAYAKARLYAPATAIVINGYMNIDMFKNAKLFSEGCTLAASIDGKEVARTLFTSNQPIAMNVEVPPESRGALTLELKNNCSLIPQAVGLGSDTRTLSFMITDIHAEHSAP